MGCLLPSTQEFKGKGIFPFAEIWDGWQGWAESQEEQELQVMGGRPWVPLSVGAAGDRYHHEGTILLLLLLM